MNTLSHGFGSISFDTGPACVLQQIQIVSLSMAWSSKPATCGMLYLWFNPLTFFVASRSIVRYSASAFSPLHVFRRNRDITRFVCVSVLLILNCRSRCIMDLTIATVAFETPVAPTASRCTVHPNPSTVSIKVPIQCTLLYVPRDDFEMFVPK